MLEAVQLARHGTARPQVKIRQDGAAVVARLEIDEAVLVASAAKSFEIKDFQIGSGGRIRPYLPDSDGA
jgi:hypothetical protein